jgi:hypothetical protein
LRLGIHKYLLLCSLYNEQGNDSDDSDDGDDSGEYTGDSGNANKHQNIAEEGDDIGESYYCI